MNTNSVLIGLIVLVLAAGGIWYISRPSDTQDQEMNTDRDTGQADISNGSNPDASGTEESGSDMTAPSPDNEETAQNPESSSPTVKEFAVAGSPFKFSLAEIKVKKGDTVRIVFTNAGGKHDWKLDEFNAATSVLEEGQSETIEFTADKAGTFEYYCSVGTHRQMGMKGNLVVEE